MNFYDRTRHIDYVPYALPEDPFSRLHGRYIEMPSAARELVERQRCLQRHEHEDDEGNLALRVHVTGDDDSEEDVYQSPKKVESR